MESNPWNGPRVDSPVVISSQYVRPMKALTASYIGQWCAFALIYIAGTTDKSLHIPGVDALAAMLLVVSSIAYYISLGILAKRSGRSWIVWVGLTILINPIGWIVAYFMMRKRIFSDGSD